MIVGALFKKHGRRRKLIHTRGAKLVWDTLTTTIHIESIHWTISFQSLLVSYSTSFNNVLTKLES